MKYLKQTILDSLKFLSQLDVNCLSELSCVIGEDNIILEINEGKLLKSKFHLIYLFEDLLAVVGCEKTEKRDIFIQVVQKSLPRVIRNGNSSEY